MSGMCSHESSRARKDEWLTPPSLLASLGEFDLDPCAPVNRPWNTANRHFTIEDDGLKLAWEGRVWMNPPYGSKTGVWLKKLAEHGDGVALIFARTETRMFFEHVWDRASALLFLKGRLCFYHANGTQATASAGAPSVLIAYGEHCAERLRTCNISGQFIPLPQNLGKELLS